MFPLWPVSSDVVYNRVVTGLSSPVQASFLWLAMVVRSLSLPDVMYGMLLGLYVLASMQKNLFGIEHIYILYF
jgi:hypothetical protein